MAIRKRERKTATVSSIQNEYVQKQRKKEVRKHAQNVRLRRRLAVFGLIALISFSIITYKFVNQKQLLADKFEEKTVLLAELDAVKEEQQTLERQIAKLGDDEYIAKLARQEYFLSDTNEIIFSIPPKTDIGKKKADKKE